jgi:flagellar hook protein FlgE
MSINGAMQAGISGLTANSNALSAISNNIANVNTVGYKTSDTQFEALVTNQDASGAANSGGVIEQTRQLVTQQGLTTQTNSPTDLAINGQGFFVTTVTPQGASGTNPLELTRAGSFTADSAGYLKNTAGLYLQGWPVDSSGNVVSTSSATQLQPINVTALSGAPSATTAAGLNANLQSTQAISAAAAAVPGAGPGAYSAASLTTSMAAYDPTTGVGVKPDYSVQIPVSDSKGGQQTLQMDFLKSSTPNQWYAEIVSVPPGNIVNGVGLPPGQIASGLVTFDATGKLLSADPALTNLAIGASGGAAPTAPAVNWATSLGVSNQSIALDLSSATGGLTQYASSSATQSITTNGTPFGNLSSIQIGSDGMVSAVFDNGVSRKIAQVAVATVPNPDELTAVTGDAYQISANSGAFTLKTAGTGGAGLLASSTLESSTVDLSAQFANLITTQRAYSASSKIITTADQMLQELINLKQ